MIRVMMDLDMKSPFHREKRTQELELGKYLGIPAAGDRLGLRHDPFIDESFDFMVAFYKNP